MTVEGLIAFLRECASPRTPWSYAWIVDRAPHEPLTPFAVLSLVWWVGCGTVDRRRLDMRLDLSLDLAAEHSPVLAMARHMLREMADSFVLPGGKAL